MFEELDAAALGWQQCLPSRYDLPEVNYASLRREEFRKNFRKAFTRANLRRWLLGDALFIWLGGEVEKWLQGVPYTYSQLGGSRHFQRSHIGRLYLLPILIIQLFAGSMGFVIGANLDSVSFSKMATTVRVGHEVDIPSDFDGITLNR